MILNEGGNVFKDPNGQIATTRINKADVAPTLDWLEKVTGLELKANTLGTTGIAPTSGDIDVAVDQAKLGKDQLVDVLSRWAIQNKQDPKQWVRKSGVSVHFKTPIRGSAKNGYVQTDLMFGDPDWMKWSLRGGEVGSEYKGADRHVMIASVAKPQGYKWSFKAGLLNRETNEPITKDPNKIAELILGKGATANDLNSVETIHAKIKDRSDYDQLIADKELMNQVDALNLNISDHFNGYGMMDGALIPNCWTQYDLARGKLDQAEYQSKKILSSESWICWDGSGNNHDVNADGKRDERDAFEKTITIFGKVLERGLNTVNMPWCDNSSRWSMGLTKRVDYSGQIKKLKPEWVTPANDGGPDVVTRKLGIHGPEERLKPYEVPESGLRFTEESYINPGDPNHLHYYIWRWYSQIAGGSNEVIRHAMAGERGNDITTNGNGFTGNEQYKISSYDRTKKSFTVLVYANGAAGTGSLEVSIPSTIQDGEYYNNEFSKIDFRGEGFRNGTKYNVSTITKDINDTTGEDENVSRGGSRNQIVRNGTLKVRIGKLRKFTTIKFTKAR